MSPLSKILIVLILSIYFFIPLTSTLAVSVIVSGCPDNNSSITVDNTDYGLSVAAKCAGFNSELEDLATITGRVIQIILQLLGVIFLILIIVGGFTWMTAGGNEEKIKKARGIIINAAIGVAIVLSAYAITYFVLSNLLTATTK